METDGWRTRLAGGGATHLSSHARHPRSATSDKTRAGQTADLADSLKESQLAAGREPPFSVGRHRRRESQQQASKRESGPRHARPPARCVRGTGLSLNDAERSVARALRALRARCAGGRRRALPPRPQHSVSDCACFRERGRVLRTAPVAPRLAAPYGARPRSPGRRAAQSDEEQRRRSRNTWSQRAHARQDGEWVRVRSPRVTALPLGTWPLVAQRPLPHSTRVSRGRRPMPIDSRSPRRPDTRSVGQRDLRPGTRWRRQSCTASWRPASPSSSELLQIRIARHKPRQSAEVVRRPRPHPRQVSVAVRKGRSG
jgi:hypothetical protein